MERQAPSQDAAGWDVIPAGRALCCDPDRVARGQFGSLLAAVNFSTGTTFVAMELFGSGADGRKGAFLAVAKNVASRV